ncbi:ATP-dependent DNA helicase RecQ [Geofilum rubicundum JCM 15548]|uniref:DNA 3'-5' helicase n=2 Tax=Geofilum TaxID=1236988 RepID=A0A0E9LVW2_9BACT|nr:ATP-dependent DNA helicase RecQ [Geofilum rubicundum JCM 15548]
MLRVVRDIKEKFKAEYVVDMLVGKPTTALKAYNHHELEVFGSGDDQDVHYWSAVIRHSLVAGLIIKEIENYGLLKLSEKGWAYLDAPYSIMLTRNHNYDEMEEETRTGASTAAVDPQLFSMLKDLRKRISKKLNLPPFVIFQDPSLEAMSTYYPITMDELQNMPGVGAGKAKRFGNDFLELIQSHVEDNEIERPIDLVVKSVANKSKLKISIIQNIDRKVSLDDIAESKGIEMNDLLKELESIVYSGTRVNIDYHIDQVMDEDHRDDIFLYFKEDAESDDIPTALEELGEDEFSEEEVRMVRIKFISEVGN